MLRVAAVAASLVLAVVPSSGDSAAPEGRTLVPPAAMAGPVAAPHFVRNIDTGETGWFSSPGVDVPAAPSIGDLDGDGALEIVLSTFDHGIDVFRGPGSGANLLPWPTGRGSLLRDGRGPATAP